jgi:hypothetical protein
MGITKVNFKNNLVRTLDKLLKAEIGTTYVNSVLGNLPITYTTVFPSNFKAYADKLPLIVIEDGGRDGSDLMEMGGRSTYIDTFVISIIAGGYKNEYHDSFLKNALSDQIYFLFDKMTYDFKNYDTDTNGTVEGNIRTYIELANNVQPDVVSMFSRHRSRLRLQIETLIYNN